MNSQQDQESGVTKVLVRGRKIYDKTPACFRRVLSPIRLVYTFFRVLRPDIWVMIGHEISSGQKLGVVYAGHEVNKNLIAKLAFNGSCRENYVGKKWLWKIRDIIEESNSDYSLVVAEVSGCFRVLSERMKFLYVPLWLSGEINILIDSAPLITNESLKSDIRKIERNKFSFEVTRELSQLHNLYYNMYLPYIAKVHGNRAVIPSYDYVKSEFVSRRSSNTLLLLKKEEEYVAGTMLICKRNRATCWFIGVKEGNPDHVRDGAIGAVYYFSIQYLRENGFSIFDFGGSRPFLKDGILRYKKKWNPKMSDRKQVGFLIKMLSRTDGAEGFFLSNPFIYEDDTGLSGAVFVARNQPVSAHNVVRIHRDYYLNGLSKLVIYRFGENDPAMFIDVPAELSDCIKVNSVESIF